MEKLILAILICFTISACKKSNPANPLKVLDDDATITPAAGVSIYSNLSVLASTGSGINEIITNNGNYYLIGSFTSLGGVYSPGIIEFTPGLSVSFTNYSNNFYSPNIISFCPRTSSTQNFFGGNYRLSATGSTNYWGYSYTGSSTTYAPAGSTLNGNVNVMKNYNGYVYFSGSFTTMNSASCSKLLYSNGYNIYQTGGTMPGGTVYDMENYNGSWYLAGSISSGNIKVQNGFSWNSVGNGFNSYINDLEIINNELYAAGNMTFDGSYSIPVNYVNKYNGSSWTSIGTNNLPYACAEIESYNGTIYACGYKYIYYFDSSVNQWKSKINSSINLGSIIDIEFINGKLYAIEYIGGLYRLISFS